MNHFLDIDQLSKYQIEALLERAFSFKNTQSFPNYQSYPVAHLFYENSTRTRVSFELAAQHLSMPSINLPLQSSSENKGEVIEDTISNLAAMGIKIFIIRHQQNGLQQSLADSFGEAVSIVNAGDGTHAHPSQALLDMLTILEKKPQLEQLKIAVLGNIKHSRVANSFQKICQKLGVGELVMIAPELWQPQKTTFGRVTASIQEGLADADVVMCLRVQKERLGEGEFLDLETYKKEFSLNEKNLSYAKPSAIVMHPGPVNRGIEIDSAIVDSSQSCILQQVTNGVFARMALLEALVK